MVIDKEKIMSNKDLFISGYLDRISSNFVQTEDTVKNRNLAFEIFSISVILNKPFQEVFDNIVIKGSKDGGIDGIWFQDQGEYFDMHVFQCKNTKSLKANEIDKFRNDFKDLFTEGNTAGKKNIGALLSKIDEYKQITEQGTIIETKLYFVFNGQKRDPINSNNEVIFNTYHNPELNFYIKDSDDLFDNIASVTTKQREEVKYTFHPEKSNISPVDTQGLYSYAILNVKAANFRIKAQELCNLMSEEERINGSVETLFEENIRSYLGIKVRANKRMNETLNNRGDAVYFPFLNNGVTLICNELQIPKQPQDNKYLVPVVNPQIVNGLQTTWVLYENYKKNPALLDDVYVNVRIYESRDKELIEKITDATNTQTPINYRDKISNRDFNRYAKEVFANKGINYIVKRGEVFGKDSIILHESVESEIVLKFWYASFYEEPETAKNSVSTVLQRIFDSSLIENHPLEKLFSGSKNSPVYKQMLISYYIYKYIQKQKPVHIDSFDFVSYADELLCYAIYKQIDMHGRDFSNDDIAKAYTEALVIIHDQLIKELKKYRKAGKNFSYNSYFKKPQCRIDYNNAMGILENESLIETLQNKEY